MWIIDRESMGHLTCTLLAMASLASQRPAHSHPCKTARYIRRDASTPLPARPRDASALPPAIDALAPAAWRRGSKVPEWVWRGPNLPNWVLQRYSKSVWVHRCPSESIQIHTPGPSGLILYIVCGSRGGGRMYRNGSRGVQMYCPVPSGSFRVRPRPATILY